MLVLYIALPRIGSFNQVLSLPSRGPKTAQNIVFKEMHIEYLSGHTFHLYNFEKQYNFEYGNHNYFHIIV
jgi:hypothetical protein